MEQKNELRKRSTVFYKCDFCNGYFSDDEIMINYKGYKIKGCPRCIMHDGLKEVSEEEYIKEHTMEGVKKVPFEKP